MLGQVIEQGIGNSLAVEDAGGHGIPWAWECVHRVLAVCTIQATGIPHADNPRTIIPEAVPTPPYER